MVHESLVFQRAFGAHLRLTARQSPGQSRCSNHAFATTQSRSTVADETSSASAVSAMLRQGRERVTRSGDGAGSWRTRPTNTMIVRVSGTVFALAPTAVDPPRSANG